MLFKGDQIEIERVRRRVDVLFFQIAQETTLLQ